MAAPASKKTLVEEIQYVETGEFFSANVFFNQNDEKALFEARRKEEKAYLSGKKYFVCALCGGAVKLRGMKTKVTIHFCHRDTKESKNCPLHQGEKLSYEDIRARKYNGAKESDLHKDMCQQLADAVEQSPNCSEVLINKVYQRTEHPNRYRPDVQALCHDKNVVFEIQLSHDFLPVIVKREAFYKLQKAYLIWIFNSFENNRFYEKDIFYGNKCHAFIFSKEQYKQSIEKKDIVFECHYYRPYITKDRTIEAKAQKKIISFKDLTFTDDFTCYYYDYDNRHKILEKALEKANLAKLKHEANRKKAHERERFSALIEDVKKQAKRTQKSKEFSKETFISCVKLITFIKRCKHINDELIREWTVEDILLLLKITYSAQNKHPIGFKFNNNKCIFNHLYLSKKDLFLYFAFLVYNHYPQLANYKREKVTTTDLNQNPQSQFFMEPKARSIVREFFKEIYEPLINNPRVKFIRN